jgi:multicomponent Na+:H+ antiporter subunit G
MALVVEVASWFFLLAGSFFVFVGGVGVLRMPELYTRIHAASLTDTLGTILIVFGVMLQTGWELELVKLLAIIVFLVISAPTASYALANAALLAGIRPEMLPPGSPVPERGPLLPKVDGGEQRP